MQGNSKAIEFPRAHIEGAPFDFSFSGVKSAVLNYINVAKMKDEEICVEDIAASFQESVVDVIVSHTIMAAKEYNVKSVALAGGVAANSGIREGMRKACDENGIKLYYPSIGLCTDNAAMIGAAGYYEYINGTRHGLDLNAIPNLKIGERR